jgi:hypothetical protein
MLWSCSGKVIDVTVQKYMVSSAAVDGTKLFCPWAK